MLGEDIGLMYFPEIDPAQGTPALGAGDTLMVLTPAAGEVAPRSRRRPSSCRPRMVCSAGSSVEARSPRTQTTPKEWYEGPYKLEVAADIVSNATSFGFDASDLMPPEANRAFWDGISAWIDTGGTDTDTFVQSVDAAGRAIAIG